MGCALFFALLQGWLLAGMKQFKFMRACFGLAVSAAIGVAVFNDLKARGEIADVDVELVIVNLYGQVLAPFVGGLGHRSYFGEGIDDPAHAARVRCALIAHTMTVLGIDA